MPVMDATDYEDKIKELEDSIVRLRETVQILQTFANNSRKEKQLISDKLSIFLREHFPELVDNRGDNYEE